MHPAHIAFVSRPVFCRVHDLFQLLDILDVRDRHYILGGVYQEVFKTLRMNVPRARTEAEGMEQVYDAFRTKVEELGRHVHPTFLITGIVTTTLMWLYSGSDDSRTNEILASNAREIQLLHEKQLRGEIGRDEAAQQATDLQALVDGLPRRMQMAKESYGRFCERVVDRLPKDYEPLQNTNKTPKDIVRASYPDAQATRQAPIATLGQIVPHAYWWITLPQQGLAGPLLGGGPTEEEAWSSAALAIQARIVRPGELGGSFREWLTEQSKRRSASDEQARLVEEWKESVAELFAQIVRWLAEDDVNQSLMVETGNVQRDEEGLGPYEIAAMRISLGAALVELIPVGRYVVGAVGQHGDLGLRPEGRVDMKTRIEKYILYRVVDGAKKKWMIIDDASYIVRLLSKPAFETALRQLLS